MWSTVYHSMCHFLLDLSLANLCKAGLSLNDDDGDVDEDVDVAATNVDALVLLLAVHTMSFEFVARHRINKDATRYLTLPIEMVFLIIF